MVEAATRICRALAVSPAIADQRLLVTITDLVLSATGDLSQRRLWALRGRRGSALEQTGRYADSVLAWRALLADQQRVLGPDAPVTLTSRSKLASILGEVGQVEMAVEEFRALLADQLRVLGPDAPATLTTRSNLASWLSEAGQVEAAVEQFGVLLADDRRTLGADAPETLATRHNLASALAEAGQVEAAVVSSTGFGGGSELTRSRLLR